MRIVITIGIARSGVSCLLLTIILLPVLRIILIIMKPRSGSCQMAERAGWPPKSLVGTMKILFLMRV